MPLPFRITPIRKEEVLRRSAMLRPSGEELRLYDECRRDAEYVLDYKITERNRPLDILGGDPLRENFKSCESVIIFTARLGDAFRELVEESDEPEKAILWQGLAAERLDALIESYLDHKETILRSGGAVLTPHFPYRWRGVPEDPFTATRIVGISFHPDDSLVSRCRTCFVTDCPSRRESAEP